MAEPRTPPSAEAVRALVGRIVAGGGIPYLDAWDHKGPLLYLVHAAAYLLPGPPSLAYLLILNGLLLAAVGQGATMR